MRTFQATLAAFAALTIVATAPARAEEVAGTYDAKFEEVANNCASASIAMTRGKLRIRKEKKDQIVVDIERIPLMSGNLGKSGSVRATSKVGPTSIEKLDGKFSVGGQIDSSGLALVFVAEYFVKGSALCTQSWNVTGVREAAPAKAPSPAGSR